MPKGYGPLSDKVDKIDPHAAGQGKRTLLNRYSLFVLDMHIVEAHPEP